MAKPLLKVENITMSFVEGHPVLKGISLELHPGKLLSIVGASGSGKTTLLRLLAAHLCPDAGQLTFLGKAMEGPDIRLVPGYEEIKLVEQHSGLRPNITAEENLNVALLGFKEDYKRDRLERLLELFHLAEYRKHFPRELSGGQQQRLTIACAIATEPAVLLMDEPFSALDPSNTSVLLQNIQKMARELKTAIVLVTHDSRYALMGDEVLVISNGQVLQMGTPKEVYHTPANEEVASFFGPVSALTPALKKHLGLPPAESFALRAEHIKVKKKGNGLSGSITRSTFMGIYHLLEVKLEKYGTLLAIDFSKTWSEGEAVVIEIPPRRIMKLPTAFGE